MNNSNTSGEIKTFLLNEFLPGEDPAALTDTTPLISTGILDSIAVLKLVTFLEGHFGIMLEAHETDAEATVTANGGRFGCRSQVVRASYNRKTFASTKI
jgi:acyl carrier protein